MKCAPNKVATGARIFCPDEKEVDNSQGTSLTEVQKLMGSTLCHFSQQHKAQRNAL